MYPEKLLIRCFQGKEGRGSIAVQSQSGKLSAKPVNTGSVVGEPNSEWQIDSFNSHRLGQMEFSRPGYYDITLEIDPPEGETVDFQWLWLGTESGFYD